MKRFEAFLHCRCCGAAAIWVADGVGAGVDQCCCRRRLRRSGDVDRMTSGKLALISSKGGAAQSIPRDRA